MDSKDFDPDFFTQQLEQILFRLRQEIDLSLPAVAREGNDEWDKYLHELNAFYYRSFSERLFPLYKNSVQEEMTRLLKISSQEDMVKRDIMANIKRYAILYNQVKSVLSLFKASREKAGEARLAISRQQDYRSAELLCTLKQLHGGFARLEELTAGTLSWMQDQELLPVWQNHPAALPALQLMPSLDRDNPVIGDALNRLLVYLTYLAKSLARLRHRQDDKKQIRGIIGEMMDRRPDFLPAAEVKALSYFYKVQIEAEADLYLNVLILSSASEEPVLFNRSLLDFENWVSGLIRLIEKATSGYSPVICASVSLDYNLNVEFIKNLNRDIRDGVEAIASLKQDLSDSSEPDLTYFGSRTLETLQPLLLRLKEARHSQVLAGFPEIATRLNRLEAESSLWAARIDLLNQRQEHHNEVLRQFLSIINMLDNHLNLLANIRADLERILAPRNISRTWKGTAVKVERIPLEKGQVFPPDYLYLLDKHLVETRIGKDGEEANLILHEEGDVFIIRVDELVEEEMPYLLIVQKG
ncbi:hypothetical protein [Syntrophomonas curvata]